MSEKSHIHIFSLLDQSSLQQPFHLQATQGTMCCTLIKSCLNAKLGYPINYETSRTTLHRRTHLRRFGQHGPFTHKHHHFIALKQLLSLCNPGNSARRTVICGQSVDD